MEKQARINKKEVQSDLIVQLKMDCIIKDCLLSDVLLYLTDSNDFEAIKLVVKVLKELVGK